MTPTVYIYVQYIYIYIFHFGDQNSGSYYFLLFIFSVTKKIIFYSSFLNCSTVPGTKKLAVPKVSTTFRWNGSEVASIANQGALYIKSLVRVPDQENSSLSEHEVTFAFCLHTITDVYIY